MSCYEMWLKRLCPCNIPMACDVSTTGTRDTGVSWQRSCSVRSVVDMEVKPLSSSCWSPVKLLHFSWFCSFSSFSLFSALSSVMWPSNLFKSLRDIWYSNSKSDSISDTATQKMVASRLLGWLTLAGSLMLSLEEEELRDLANKTCCSQTWIRSSVALRGGSDPRSACPNFFGTEELLWCPHLSSLLRLSCPMLFLLDSILMLVRKSGEVALQQNHMRLYNSVANRNVSKRVCNGDTNLVNAAIRSLFLRHSARWSTTNSRVSNNSIT